MRWSTRVCRPATAGHFHGPAAVGKNAAVLIPIMAPLGSPINCMAKLTDAEIADFAAGSVYVNIHTEKTRTGKSAARSLTDRRRCSRACASGRRLLRCFTGQNIRVDGDITRASELWK
ncbi:CHRD domain-containing protein [Dongia soli]|uniref:CHRD domain-containing protein n=1 Tax=Dongia soli TaxID=600628 RepID=A0ABU5EG95_9PROT|nr:CHRD domain-containing protein [Dongia soli]MDY0884463.1 CHRD domain-containing protein [Dongia soli]